MADSLDADSANSPHVRQILRNRARYEYFNNCYCWGIVNSVASDVIRTGPRLQCLTDDKELNKQIEEDFAQWAEEIRLAKKLRITERSQIRDGEGFILLFTNPRLDSLVKLDLKLYETERCSSTEFFLDDERFIDGIRLDDYGNRLSYQILKHHPGSTTISNINQYTTYPAKFILHAYDQQRAEQHRGIPEILPALPLFAYLRRYTLSTVSAAEQASNFAGILYTDLPPEATAVEADPKTTMDVFRNMLVTVPAGWKMGQIDSKNPNAQYREFKNEVLDEYARCLSVPHNVASGNSSGYNYASGRLDWQNYESMIALKRHDTEIERLKKIFLAWLQEYALINPRVMSIPRYRLTRTLKIKWFWDQRPHVDPKKEAESANIKLESKTTNYAIEYAKQGRDWREEFEQIALEKKVMQELGITEQDISQNLEQSNG